MRSAPFALSGAVAFELQRSANTYTMFCNKTVPISAMPRSGSALAGDSILRCTDDSVSAKAARPQKAAANTSARSSAETPARASAKVSATAPARVAASVPQEFPQMLPKGFDFYIYQSMIHMLIGSARVPARAPARAQQST